MLGGTLFLIWLIRSKHLPTVGANTTKRFARAIRLATQIGLIVFPVALLANVFGYVNLANLLGNGALRSAYVAAALYAALRIVEGSNHHIAGGAPAWLDARRSPQPADASAAYLRRC